MAESERKIHINYKALHNTVSEDELISEELLKKAKGFFGGNARNEIVRILEPHIRQIAAQVAQRQIHPQILCNAGREGLFEALKMFEIGGRDKSFKDFSIPFIRQAMERAKGKHGGPPA